MPTDDYPKTLVTNINKKMNLKRKWYYGVASPAAVFMILLSFAVPFKQNNIVYAMEQAYHEVFEVVETSAEGKSVADKPKVEVPVDSGI